MEFFAGLFSMVRAVHQTVEMDTMLDPETMTEFMGHYLFVSLKNLSIQVIP